MKSRKLANKFWLGVGVVAVIAVFCLSPFVSVTVTPSAAATNYAAPTYQYNQSWYEELGVVDYNNYLQELQATSSLKKVTVAVVDSGLDYTSSSVFDGRVNTQYARNFNWTGGRTTQNWNIDESGHGTHVAGVIAAGSMANVQILPIRVFVGANNKMTFDVFDRAMNYLVEKQKVLNIVAVNLSLGTAGLARENYETEEKFNEAFSKDLSSYQPYINKLRNAGILPVVAAGNIDKDAGEKEDRAYYAFPACCEGALSVSAYYRDNKTKAATRASFSYYNERVSLSAPGVSIWSACTSYLTPSDPNILTYYPEAGNNVYYYKKDANHYVYVRKNETENGITYDLRMQGTSMATPFVTLCYALICSDPTKTTTESLGVEWDAAVDTKAPYYYLNPQHKALLLNARDFYLKDEPGKTDMYFGYGGVTVKAFAQGEVTEQKSKTEEEVSAPSLPKYVPSADDFPPEIENWASAFWILIGMTLVMMLVGYLYGLRQKRSAVISGGNTNDEGADDDEDE